MSSEVINNIKEMVVSNLGEIIAVSLMALSGLFITWLSTHIKEHISAIIAKIKNRRFYKSVEQLLKINTYLTELRLNTKCERIIICQFHNGKKFINEQYHTYSFTCTFENKELGISTIKNEIKGIKISEHSIFINDLLNHKVVKIDLNTKRKNNIYEWNLQHGFHSYVAQIIYNNKNEIIGFITLTWNDEIVIDSSNLDLLDQFIKSIKYYF